MSINTKPVEEKPIFDDISSIEKGRIRYILEVFKCSEIQKDPDLEFQIKSRISQVNSKPGSAQQSANASKIVSRTSMVNKRQSINLNGKAEGKSKKAKKAKIVKDSEGNSINIVTFNSKDMLNKYPLININPIPPRKFSIRMIVWNAEDVPSMDMGGSSDS